MPVIDTLVRFQLSGGNANENPHLSLGGQISTAAGRNVVSNVLHSFFDEVSNTEAVSGEYEYRHFYYRNSHTDFAVKNVRLIVIADTTSIWSKIEFAKGTATNGNVEQAIPNENTAPSGISDTNWRIPSASNPLIIGDVAAGSTASIWCRRKIEPGSLIARNEKVHIRIIADPPIPVSPPITCPTGQHFDPTTQTCVDDEDPDDPGSGVPCPQGQHLENGQCVPDGQPPPPSQPVDIMIVGDIGCNGDAEQVLRTAGQIFNPDLFIANGDLSYTSTRNCFTSLLESLGLRAKTKISIGNHDDEEEESTSLRNSYISYFGIPSNGYYSFNIQNIHVLVMDTQSSYGSNSAQFTFARNDLQTASQTAAIDWIIVCYHKPSITIDSDHEALTDFRDTYHALFDQFKVDLVVMGHNHNMQRTYPIRHNAANPSSPTIVSQAAGHNYTNVDGRIYCVVGSGGRALDDLGSRPAHFAFANADDFGLLSLQFKNNNKLLDARFVTSGVDEADIEDLHIFTITKTNT